jgi:beta-lactamase superfamily II metal-dependent hydrolase
VSITFDFLPNAKGEAILVKANNCNLLIDGGSSHPFREGRLFGKVTENIPTIDICVVTHIDNDHINGIIALLKNEGFLNNLKQIWFNEPKSASLFSKPKIKKKAAETKTSFKQGESLEKIIQKYPHIKHVSNISTSKKHLKNFESIYKDIEENLKFTLLSPSEDKIGELYKKWQKNIFLKKGIVESKASKTKLYSIQKEIIDCNYITNKLNKQTEKDLDQSIPNGSSIAFILDYSCYKFLFLADAHINVICNSLENQGVSEDKPLDVDFVKMSHHGSIKNINRRFFELVITKTYIICRNERKKLPNKEVISSICCCRKNTNDQIQILINKDFNDNLKIFDKEDLKKYGVEIKNQTKLFFD